MESSSAHLVVLGVDPGLTRCGIGVVSGPAASPRLVDASCLRTQPHTPIERRLLTIHDGLAAAIAEHRPDVVAVEQVLFSVNVRTAMATGQAAGVALLAAARAGLEVTSYTPTEIKLTVAGSGGADKSAVGRLVAAQLALATPPSPPDVADALAVALTHLARSRVAVAAGRGGGARALDDARRDAERVGRGGWQAHLAARGLLDGTPR